MSDIDKELDQDNAEQLVSFQPDSTKGTKEQEEKKSKEMHGIPTTVFTHNGVKYPILASHSPFPIVKRILTHNSVTGYTWRWPTASP